MNNPHGHARAVHAVEFRLRALPAIFIAVKGRQRCVNSMLFLWATYYTGVTAVASLRLRGQGSKRLISYASRAGIAPRGRLYSPALARFRRQSGDLGADSGV
jgi:hypothetical protein